MIYRSRAPLRIGLAGGGTDVSPYCDMYGGAILNASISLYAYAHLELTGDETIILEAKDRNEEQILPFQTSLPINGTLDLHKGVFNRIQKDYGWPYKGFRLTTYSDAPAGSGLGTSSTMMVAILGAFNELLKLPLGEYDIAHYAYEIERKDLQLAGGRQDQYAATFGGVNFMEFYKDDQVIVNPLRIRQEYLDELQNNLILYYTDSSRDSATIIKAQQQNVTEKKEKSIEAMHQLKEQARMMKEAMLKGKIDALGEILDYGFEQKRKMADHISNARIEEIYAHARRMGATGGKISGAGGGGFMIFYCPGISRYSVIEGLKSFGGTCRNYHFTNQGLTSWTAGK
jgi:D-glycero-alpha-D-manno-heptose-7-phosphate kinase